MSSSPQFIFASVHHNLIYLSLISLGITHLFPPPRSVSIHGSYNYMSLDPDEQLYVFH
jgi:hypothetical protein